MTGSMVARSFTPQDGQAPSFRPSEFSVNKVTTVIGNDAEQKSAKPKVQTQGDRDFEAVRTHGVRSGIPRRNGNCYGSITNLPSGDTLAYDCEGNLACVSNTVSGAVSFYWYDQHGRRVAKSESGLLTLYIWDGMDIIATAHADGTIREYYTRGIGIAGDVGSLVAETRFSGGTATTTYLHSNWRGDVVMATDTSGAVVGEYAYTTFGEQLSATGTYTPRFTFSSKERDASGLVYFGFRYYSPVLCRWISEDPIGEAGGINLYQFCGNNPVNYADPDGWARQNVDLGNGYIGGVDTQAGPNGTTRKHIHVYRNGVEVAKVTQEGKWMTQHNGRVLLKPSQMPRPVRNAINSAVRKMGASSRIVGGLAGSIGTVIGSAVAFYTPPTLADGELPWSMRFPEMQQTDPCETRQSDGVLLFLK